MVAGFCGLHALPAASMRGRCGGLGQAGASIPSRHTFEVARHDVGQVGHVGQATSNSKAYQCFSLPDMAFPMSGACRACRARPASWGIMRDGWKAWAGCGPWEAWGGARRAGRLFPLVAGSCGLHALPAASMRGRCGGMRQAGTSVLLVPAKRAELKKFPPPTKPLFWVLLIKIASKLSTMCLLALIFAHFPPFYRHGAKASHTIQPFTIAQQKAVSPRHAVYGKMNATPLSCGRYNKRQPVAPLTFRARCIISKTCRQSAKSASAGRASYPPEAFLFPTTRSVPSPYTCRISPPAITTVGNSPVSGTGHGSHQ